MQLVLSKATIATNILTPTPTPTHVKKAQFQPNKSHTPAFSKRPEILHAVRHLFENVTSRSGVRLEKGFLDRTMGTHLIPPGPRTFRFS